MRELKELEKRIGYHFQNPELLEKALRHSSYANEHKMNRIECNERLEFLGDAVLELVSSEHLFAQFPQFFQNNLCLHTGFLIIKLDPKNTFLKFSVVNDADIFNIN